MRATNNTSAERVDVYSVIVFGDTGPCETMCLGTNMTHEEADALFEMVPAVSYGGQRPVMSAFLTRVPTGEPVMR